MHTRYRFYSIFCIVQFWLNFAIYSNVKSYNFVPCTCNIHILVKPLLNSSTHSNGSVFRYTCLEYESIRTLLDPALSFLYRVTMLLFCFMIGLLSVVIKYLFEITIFSSFSYYMTVLIMIHCIVIVFFLNNCK